MISQKILSITAVCELVGRNRRTLWAWVRDGVFPKEGANKSYGTRAFTGNPLILND